MAHRRTIRTAGPRSRPARGKDARRSPPGKTHKPTGSACALRLEHLRALMAAQDLPFLLVTNPLDVGYLTNFLGGDSFLLVGLEPKVPPVIISDFRYKEELEPLAADFEIIIRTGGIIGASAKLLGARAIARCGVQSEQMTVADKRTLTSATDGGAELVDTTNLVGRLRVEKDASEVELIRKAIRIQEQALKALLKTLRPGQTELEVAARLESEMKSRGSSVPSFETIIAAGPAGSLPHYRPGSRKLAKNQPVLIDWGATYLGYKGDMTRTFALGKWPAKIAEIYRIVLDAHELAAQALAPGKDSKQVDAIAREHIARCGYGEHFGHGLGHGIGLNVHEAPRLSHMVEGEELRPGMVVTIEPGIYLPGVGGVRIEDDYLITQKGVENLSSLPRKLEWATL